MIVRITDVKIHIIINIRISRLIRQNIHFTNRIVVIRKAVCIFKNNITCYIINNTLCDFHTVVNCKRNFKRKFKIISDCSAVAVVPRIISLFKLLSDTNKVTVESITFNCTCPRSLLIYFSCLKVWINHIVRYFSFF